MFSKILGSRDKKNSSDKREPLIGGRFKCSSEILGEGIEGQVRLGTDVDTNEPVALKLIDRSRLSVKDLERLDLEISILLNLRHQNIISLKHAELYCKGSFELQRY
jgi:serine/threonine protein kinase